MAGIGQFSIGDWRKLLALLRDPWADFVPTLTQSTTVLSFTIKDARYVVVGKTALVQFSLTITSAGVVGSSILMSGFPSAITPKATGQLAMIGSGAYARTGGIVYPVVVEANLATRWGFYGGNGTSYLGINPSFAAADGDVIGASLAYEIA